MLKDNVNKIHSELSSKYDVLVEECSDLKFGNFVKFSVTENNKKLVIKITKRNLENNLFEWVYLSNPDDENSIVERKSNVSDFLLDVSDIFNKNRFNTEYLKKIN